MEWTDAFIVAGAGYTVVFMGLVMTSLIIYGFAVLPRVIERFKSPKNKEPVAEKPVKTIENIDDDVLTAIATVIEIERRLHYTSRVSRYTFKERRGTGLI